MHIVMNIRLRCQRQEMKSMTGDAEFHIIMISATLLGLQAKLNEILSKIFQAPNRTGLIEMGPLYAVERFRDSEVLLQNKLHIGVHKIKTHQVQSFNQPGRRNSRPIS